MKAIVLIDIPEDNSLDILSPFNTNVTLDYGDKVLELRGEICDIPRKKNISELTQNDRDEYYEQGYDDCIDDILGQ